MTHLQAFIREAPRRPRAGRRSSSATAPTSNIVLGADDDRLNGNQDSDTLHCVKFASLNGAIPAAWFVRG